MPRSAGAYGVSCSRTGTLIGEYLSGDLAGRLQDEELYRGRDRRSAHVCPAQLRDLGENQHGIAPSVRGALELHRAGASITREGLPMPKALITTVPFGEKNRLPLELLEGGRHQLRDQPAGPPAERAGIGGDGRRTSTC